MGLSERAGHYPHQLSGGQQQRVAIARALALHPDILCFDEPTSALDPELTGEVLRVLRDLADRKTTMIIVTHEMHFARDVADRIMFMDGGVVVEEGPARQLIDHPQEERTKQFWRTTLNKTGYGPPRSGGLFAPFTPKTPRFAQVLFTFSGFLVNLHQKRLIFQKTNRPKEDRL